MKPFVMSTLLAQTRYSDPPLVGRHVLNIHRNTPGSVVPQKNARCAPFSECLVTLDILLLASFPLSAR